jgi:magnesium transporter
MLRVFPRADGAVEAEPTDTTCWIDLVAPSPEEIALVHERYGIVVPTEAALQEIEATSRLRADGDTLYMSAPFIEGVTTDRWQVAPTGFILTPDICITIRFVALPAFDQVADELAAKSDLVSAEVLVRLLEEVVDRAADHLERAAEAVSDASHAIFVDPPKRRSLSRNTALLRDTMRSIGRASDRASRVRYMFLNIGRMASFVIDRCDPKLDEPIRARLEAVRHDIASLDEFEASLSGRIQLLQDSAAGFISIEQNEVVKVLTVVSVVGVPPVLVVGIYGMNFRFMPELQWHYGYPLALVLCVLSAVVPLLWFRWRDWI